MAEQERYLEQKLAKEAMRAFALGLEVEREAGKPVLKKLRELLGFYLSLEGTKLLRKADNSLKKAGVVFLWPSRMTKIYGT